MLHNWQRIGERETAAATFLAFPNRRRRVRRMRMARMTMAIRIKPAMAMPMAKSRCGKQMVVGS